MKASWKLWKKEQTLTNHLWSWYDWETQTLKKSPVRMIIIPWMQRRSNIWKEINAICHINTHKGKIYFFQKCRCGIWQKTISIHDKKLISTKKTVHYLIKNIYKWNTLQHTLYLLVLLNTFSVESGKVGMHHINASIWRCTAHLQCTRKWKIWRLKRK